MTDQPRADAIAALRLGEPGDHDDARFYRGWNDAIEAVLAALAPADPTAGLRAALTEDDRRFLLWCYERFHIVFGESVNLDWMQRLAALAAESRPEPDWRALLHAMVVGQEYDRMEAEGKAAEALGLTWDDGPGQWVPVTPEPDR